jgi:hypothetical protein
MARCDARPNLADAILDRLEHNAYKVELRGVPMRKKRIAIDQKSEPLQITRVTL